MTLHERVSSVPPRKRFIDYATWSTSAQDQARTLESLRARYHTPYGDPLWHTAEPNEIVPQPEIWQSRRVVSHETIEAMGLPELLGMTEDRALHDYRHQSGYTGPVNVRTTISEDAANPLWQQQIFTTTIRPAR
jgi:hypothetical protein